MMACGHGYAACVAALFESGLPIDLDLRDANLQSAYQARCTDGGAGAGVAANHQPSEMANILKP
jgi:hypothetical protein